MIEASTSPGLHKMILAWVSVMLNYMKVRVGLRGWFSKLLYISRGVPQGAPLSALLYDYATYFMLADVVKNGNVWVCHGHMGISS